MSHETRTEVSAALPPSRWNGALIVSLCLNFLLIGALAMMCWRWSNLAASNWMQPGTAQHFGMRHGPGMGHEGFGFGLGRGPLNPHFLAHIVPGKADAIGRILDSHRSKLGEFRGASMAARDEAVQVLAEENYSQDRFVHALDDVRKADNALEGEVLRIVSESAGVLSPQERRTVAQARMHLRGGFGFGHGGGPN